MYFRKFYNFSSKLYIVVFVGLMAGQKYAYTRAWNLDRGLAAWLSNNVMRCRFLFPTVPWDFSVVDNYSVICPDWMFPCLFPLSIFCPVLYSEEAPDQRSGEDLVLYVGREGFTERNFVVL